MKAALRREIDVVAVRRLDRWGQSVADLMARLREPTEQGVGFVSPAEALDQTTPSGRATAGVLAIFAEFERKVARERSAPRSPRRGRNADPGATAECVAKAEEVGRLKVERSSHSEIAPWPGIGRTSVRRILRVAG